MCLQQTHSTKSITTATTAALSIGPRMLLPCRWKPPTFAGSGDGGSGVPPAADTSVGGLPFPSVQVATIVDPPRVKVWVLTSAF